MSSIDKSLSPLERLHCELEGPAYNRWLSAVPVSASEETHEIVAEVVFRPEFSYDADATFWHGGVIASFIDITGYAAVAVWHGGSTPTINLQIDYLAPARGEKLTGRGLLRKLGRAIARVDIEISCSGKLVALGRGTFSSASLPGKS